MGQYTFRYGTIAIILVADKLNRVGKQTWIIGKLNKQGCHNEHTR